MVTRKTTQVEEFLAQRTLLNLKACVKEMVHVPRSVGGNYNPNDSCQ